ncbi:MAG TPA: hypothetical protein PKU78_00070 [Candidatus Dojkabacteria bacterium]|nr:hypothetical protein [Candidatus Dojkabacteria bacterium]HRO64599.1 hypothetical protein [Candidatus Dojkabacteria bacterium]HRP36799.1 hypothetical protein [Candidatus Dojkabacteria bacterium]HRP50868.1 hypothetical protein [Candidatus Dojkabacteria bacterium]
MDNTGQILLITLVTAIGSSITTYLYRKRKIAKKDYSLSDHAKTKRPDITIGM